MSVDKNEKLETVKDLVGSRAAYHDTIQALELNEQEQDLLMRASIEVKKGKPNLDIIDRAYTILVGKNFQGEDAEENTASEKPHESKAKEEKDTKRTILNGSNRVMKYIVIIALIIIILFSLRALGDYNKIYIGESTTVEYTYDGTGNGAKIIRNVKINIANNYTRINDGDLKDRAIKVTIKNLGFHPFILHNDQIYQMDGSNIIKNGGMSLPGRSKDNYIEILAGETDSFFVRVEYFADKIYIKKPSEEGDLKTVLTLDVPNRFNEDW